MLTLQSCASICYQTWQPTTSNKLQSLRYYRLKGLVADASWPSALAVAMQATSASSCLSPGPGGGEPSALIEVPTGAVLKDSSTA